jgi:sarcosine oxidase subunit beta
MSTKAIVCRCEDVTLADIQHTLAIGYRTVEEVKRYTGLGTGPCEGKECMAQAARLCLTALQQDGPNGKDAKVEPFTSRPPVQPAPLGIFARGDEEP